MGPKSCGTRLISGIGSAGVFARCAASVASPMPSRLTTVSRTCFIAERSQGNGEVTNRGQYGRPLRAIQFKSRSDRLAMGVLRLDGALELSRSDLSFNRRQPWKWEGSKFQSQKVQS